MKAEKMSEAVWRLEDQEWWKKYSAVVNGKADPEPDPQCPTVPAGMCAVYTAGSKLTLQVIKDDSEPCRYVTLPGSACMSTVMSSGSAKPGSSGSGSASGVICYGMHLL